MRHRLAAPLALLAALFSLAEGAADSGRGRLLDAESAQPWRGVGRVNIGGLRTSGLCTGTLIAPDVVLTAAHCVVHQRTGVPHRLGSIYFVAGWLGGEMSASSDAAAISIHPFYKAPNDAVARELASDLALIRLRDPVAPEAAEPLAVAPPPPPGTPIVVVSYRRDRPHALTYQEGCTFDGQEGPLILLGCSVASGASGAPVLAEIDGRLRVFATLVAMSEGERAIAVQAEGAVQNLLRALDNPGAADPAD